MFSKSEQTNTEIVCTIARGIIDAKCNYISNTILYRTHIMNKYIYIYIVLFIIQTKLQENKSN